MAENIDHFCMCLIPEDSQAANNTKGALLRGAKWDIGATITVRFLEGSPTLRKRVEAVAKEWAAAAYINFDFRNKGPTHIRIAFAQGQGSWSHLGTLCKKIPEPEPTMNYGWLTDASSDAEVRRVVLHEFGHAIGFIHEHQNSDGGIKWNKPAVIKDLSGPPNNWDEKTIENNMFKFYQDLDTTKIDPKSIMMYPIPKSWTLDGFSADLNDHLSTNDKALVRREYPGRP